VKGAESCLNAAIATFVLPRWADVLDLIGQTGESQKVRAWATTQVNAIQNQCWNGHWLKRAWVTDDVGWIGDLSGSAHGLFLSPQQWAILGGLPNDMAMTVVGFIDDMLRKRSPIGAAQASAPYTHTPPGTGENGAVWASQSYPLVWALTKVNKSMAYDEWIKNTLAYEAEAYPDFWAGIWTSSDSVNSFFSNQQGQAGWPEMPILCTHRHAWPLFTAAKLAGLEFTAKGVWLEPSIPLSAGNFSFSSPLASIKRIVASGRVQSYSGHYHPAQFGQWHVTLVLPAEENISGILLVNNQKEIIQISTKGNLEFLGEGGGSQPLTWEWLHK